MNTIATMSSEPLDSTVAVTGSLPVTVITREEIQRSGATTPMELLQQISSNNSAGSTTTANSVGGLTFSAQTASLRGLGARARWC